MKALETGSRTALLLVALVLASCGGSAKNDPTDATTDDDVPGRGAVSLDGDDPLVLYVREQATITGTYRDVAGAGAQVFLEASFQGTAHDATLEDTTVTSAPDGSFSFSLTAGTLASTFQLRVEAEDGAQDELEVQVTDMATDSLSVDVSYGGRRAIDFYVTTATTGSVGECPALSGDEVHSAQTDDATVPFSISLPGATPLALAVSGAWCETGEDACLPVHGCVDALTLEESEEDTVTVVLEDDLGVFASTDFVVNLTVDPGEAASRWVDELIAPVRAMTLGTDDPAHYLLDAIYEKVLAEYGTSHGDLFISARVTGNLDSALDGALAADGLDMGAVVAALDNALVSVMHPLMLEGMLEGDFWGVLDQSAVHRVQWVGGPAGMAAAPDILAADPADAEVTVTYAADLVALETYALPVGLGEVLEGLMQEVVLPELQDTGGPVTLDEYLRGQIDCAIVAGTIYGEPTARSVATQDWYELTCREVLGDVAADVGVEAGALDSEHPGLVVQGECDFLDTTYRPREGGACEGVLTEVSWGSEMLDGSHGLRLEMPDE
jgi:hypothetical protein